jgi:hypothetical protein
MSTPPVGPEPPIAVVRFPSDPGVPITLSFLSVPVEVMIVEKGSVPMGAEKIASEDWAVAGVYVLLGPASDADAKIRARPGMGADVLFRLRQHPTENDWFTRAVVARDMRQGWNSAEAGYLEGRLHDLCRDADGVEHIFRRDHDETLQDHEENLIDRLYLPGIIATLRLAGVPIEATWT